MSLYSQVIVLMLPDESDATAARVAGTALRGRVWGLIPRGDGPEHAAFMREMTARVIEGDIEAVNPDRGIVRVRTQPAATETTTVPGDPTWVTRHVRAVFFFTEEPT